MAGPPSATRVLAAVGRAEAARLLRHPALVAGVLGAGALALYQGRDLVARWWVTDVRLGTALLLVGVAALVAGHLARSRDRRDQMATLYDSYPTSAARRTGGHLGALVAPVLASALLLAFAMIWFDANGAIGTPRALVLAGALALVGLLGALGVALGTWAPQGWAGVLAGVVVGAIEVDLVVPSYDQPLRFGAEAAWLFPWHQPSVSRSLPGAVRGFPPAGAHLVELVGLGVLVGVLALAVGRPAGRRLVAGGLVACVAIGATGWAGWSETRPLAITELDRLVATAVHPGAAERCVTRRGVTYCAYPAYLPWVTRWAVPVGGVLAHLPNQPARHLVVRQVVDSNFLCFPSLTGLGQAGLCYGISGPAPTGRRVREVSRLGSLLDLFQARLGTDPSLIPGSSNPPVYVGLNWGAGGSLGPVELNLALGSAYWAVGLPTTGEVVHAQGGTQQLSCLPVGQAREAVALWLAASATPATRTAFFSEVDHPAFVASSPFGNGHSQVATLPLGSFSVDTAQSVQTTFRATLLAAEMARLPARHVEAVLGAQWSHWLNWHTSDAALAAALGLRLPNAPTAPSFEPAKVGPPNQIIQAVGPPASPVCH
ncbi:MAG: hypothetical protein ACYDGN_12375 [Acidimicrobiales bacterium]